MKAIQNKYAKSQLEYINLDKLAFKVIRKKNDNFTLINNSDKIRRNMAWSKELFSPQSTLFDLGDLYLLSRVHIKNSNMMRLKFEVSNNEEGPFVKVESDILVITGKIRVIKIGSLPCRYFRITILRGGPIMDFSRIECYGLHINDVKTKFDDDTLEILYYNSYDLLYDKEQKDEY